MNTPAKIVEDTANVLWRVWDTGNPDLQHVWFGVPVKRVRGGFVDRANARPQLVRKAGCSEILLIAKAS